MTRAGVPPRSLLSGFGESQRQYATPTRWGRCFLTALLGAYSGAREKGSSAQVGAAGQPTAQDAHARPQSNTESALRGGCAVVLPLGPLRMASQC